MRIFFILVLIGSNCIYSYGCDFCNCYLGLNPGYNKNTIGVRGNLRFASLNIPSPTLRLSHLGHGETTPTTGGELKETFASMEIFARIYPISKLQLIFNMPYSVNTIEYHDTSETRSGLSDMTLLAMYQLANTMPLDSGSVRHRVFAGVGIKLPTGKYEAPDDVTIPMADHLYSGTGSTDVIFAVSYLGKLNKLGWNADMNFKINSENNLNYKYGNSVNFTPRLFYEFKLHALTIYPHIGAAYESGDTDELDGLEQSDTGGEIIYGSAGIDWYFNIFSIASELKLPLYNDLASGMPVDKSWFIASVNIHF
ncbi:MAG: hypothetical protein IPP71_16505 [Bacteroidetes bacterium]|nr:hypothetical protein [Bacteroidota bacterium]